MSQFVGYCFEYTKADIIQDVRINKVKSSMLGKIKAEKKKGTCRCETKHPEKR